MSDNRKILIALQICPLDKAPGMVLAKLIADLEPRHSDRADFLFFARFDTELEMGTINYVARKFNTQHYLNRWHRGTGWPFGCNQAFSGLAEFIYARGEARKFADYKAVLIVEADACPMHPNWISQLSNDWDVASAKGAKIFGPLIEGEHPHINANCMFSTDRKFMKWLARDAQFASTRGGWDWLLAPEFKQRGWADSTAMRSWWRYPSMSQETYDSLLAQGVAFFHGVRDASLRNLVRKRFIG